MHPYSEERKKKRKHGQRRCELERKLQEHPLCGGGHGNPLAKKPQTLVEPLTMALPGGASGSAAAPIPVEEEIGSECFKCGRTGFFCMEFEDDEEDVGSDLKAFNGAILSAEPGKLSIHTLKQELKHMVSGEWDWQISQVGDDDFSEFFPSADLLHMAKSSGKLFLSINDITVKVRDTIHEEITPLSMPEVWLRLYGIPKKHRRVARLMEGLKILGRPIVVDEPSLIRLGPVRMKFGCKVPYKMMGSSRFGSTMKDTTSRSRWSGCQSAQGMGRRRLALVTLPHGHLTTVGSLWGQDWLGGQWFAELEEGRPGPGRHFCW
ncbi:heat stress transcription factor c-1b [Hordeum vulgare]|nr:heat stress transcription factor c-1b [Hordeum vulgare]